MELCAAYGVCCVVCGGWGMGDSWSGGGEWCYADRHRMDARGCNFPPIAAHRTPYNPPRSPRTPHTARQGMIFDHVRVDG